MPAVSPSGSHRAGSRRRAVSEINMVPFIDVMLVLLIIFMVSAPLITAGVVDLPTAGASRQRPERVIEVVVASDEGVRLRIDGKDDGPVVAAGGTGAEQRLRGLVARVREVQSGDASVPVVISADRGVRYESVVRVMDGLQRAGVQRVGLAVKSGA